MSETRKVLLLEVDISKGLYVASEFKKEGIELRTVPSIEELVIATEKRDIDVIISSYEFHGVSGIDLFHLARSLNRDCKFIFFTETIPQASVITMIKSGVSDWLENHETPALIKKVKEILLEKNLSTQNNSILSNGILLRSVLDAMSEHLVVINGNGHILECNESWNRFLEIFSIPLVDRSNLIRIFQHLKIGPKGTSLNSSTRH
jgi:DNA-binding NtrC family response regulator